MGRVSGAKFDSAFNCLSELHNIRREKGDENQDPRILQIQGRLAEIERGPSNPPPIPLHGSQQQAQETNSKQERGSKLSKALQKCNDLMRLRNLSRDDRDIVLQCYVQLNDIAGDQGDENQDPGIPPIQDRLVEISNRYNELPRIKVALHEGIQECQVSLGDSSSPNTDDISPTCSAHPPLEQAGNDPVCKAPTSKNPELKRGPCEIL